MPSTAPEERGQKLPPRLYNVTCIYCGEPLDEASTTKEHVVGRCFVPRGSFQGNWNLIGNACLACNSAKSRLEDDISAISMQPTAFGDFAANDPSLHAEAKRKEVATSKRTGKAVAASKETITIKTPFAGGSATFEAVCSPQIDRERAFELARMHVGAFFYFITYDKNRRRGGFCQGEFLAVEMTAKGDWGSDLNRSFMNTVACWDYRVVFVGARAYFKIAIRRHPAAECWSWAVEWNQNIRVVGLMGDPATIAQTCASLTPNVTTSLSDGHEIYRFRPEVPLPATDDVLFQMPPA